MIRKLRVKLVCILMALLTVMLGVTFGLVLHFTQQSLEAESLRTLEALANNWQTASSPGLDDGTRVPYFALEINARGDIITTRGGYFDLSDREKLQKLIDIAVNSDFCHSCAKALATRSPNELRGINNSGVCLP